MDELREEIEIQLELMGQTLACLPLDREFSTLSDLEVGGVGAALHSFYNGAENILRRLLLERGHPLPSGPSWHIELLDLAADLKYIAPPTHDRLDEYRAFRHVFVHGYSVNLQATLLESLARGAMHILAMMRNDLGPYLGQ